MSALIKRNYSRGYHIHALYLIISACESEFYLSTKALFIEKNKACGLSRAATPLRHDEDGMTLVLDDHEFHWRYGGLVSRIKDLELRS